MPITREVFAVLFESKPPAAATESSCNRPHEESESRSRTTRPTRELQR